MWTLNWSRDLRLGQKFNSVNGKIRSSLNIWSSYVIELVGKKLEYDAHSEVLSLEGLEDDPGRTSALSLQSEKRL